jgi:hypothetical protein
MVISGFSSINAQRSAMSFQKRMPPKFGYAPPVSVPPSSLSLTSGASSSLMGQLILSSYEVETLKKKFSSGGVESKYPIGALMDLYRVKQANPTQSSFSIHDLLSVSQSSENSEWSVRALGRALNALTTMRQPLVASYVANITYRHVDGS